MHQPPPPPPGPHATGGSVNASASSSNRQKKGGELTTGYAYTIATEIQNTYNMADHTKAAQERLFREFFGCDVHIIMLLWSMMEELDVIPQGVKVVHCF